jgi:hypothetical protein
VPKAIDLTVPSKYSLTLNMGESSKKGARKVGQYAFYSASLGELIAQGKQNLQAPWLGLTAFFTLALILSLLVFIGEALRDAFDPRS